MDRNSQRWNLGRRGALTLALLTVLAGPSRAAIAEELQEFFSGKLEAIATTARSGSWDAYATGFAWHVPWAYDSATRARLNEAAWGGGLGRSTIDEDGDRHSVFLVGFTDSHRASQFVAAYAWQRYWKPAPDWHVGFGYAAFLFSREDVANRLPLPAALPCLSIRRGRIEIFGLFVPRVSKDVKGDVFFVFSRFALGAKRPASR